MVIYLDRRGKTSGPHSVEELWQMLERGELNELDEVWCEGSPEPIPAVKLMAAGPRSEAAIMLLAGPPPLAAAPQRGRAPGLGWLFLLQFAGPVGCLGSSGLGTGLLVLLCIGFYFWGTAANNRSGMEERRTNELRGKIVRFVKDNPQHGAPSLDELHRLGAITDEEKQFVNDLGLTYKPISAQSPDDSIVFVRPTSMGERRYYKGESTRSLVHYDSRDGEWTVRCDPAEPSQNKITVQLIHLDTQRVLHQQQLDAYSVHAEWSRDSRYVVMNLSARTSDDHFRVFEVSGAGVKPIAMPAALDPAENLAEAERGEPLRWKLRHVRGFHWRDPRTLEIESNGGAEVGAGPAGASDYLSIRMRFAVQIQQNGDARIIERKMLNYHRSEPRRPAAGRVMPVAPADQPPVQPAPQ